MAGNPQVVVDFISNTSGLSSGFRQAEGASSGFGARLKGLGKAAAAGIAAAGIGAVVKTLQIGIAEYTQASKVAAQTNAVIKSTGGVAHVTAKQVDDLATGLMKKSGIDDEAIKSGENLLLTFTRIHNEAGKGNDIFTQATRVMVDMSVALGQDMTTSAMQLGKALNDPVKGMTALKRVGVTFDADQQARIKGFVESGHAMEAQKVILQELNREFGGSAAAAGKTLPGQLAIAKQEFNNFAGDLVAKMIPALQASISWLKDKWPGVLSVLQTVWQTVGPLLVAIGQLFVAAVKLIADNWQTIGPIIMTVVGIIQNALAVAGAIIKAFTAILRGDWASAWQYAQAIVTGYAALIMSVVKALGQAIIGIFQLLDGALRALTNATWSAIRSLIGAAVNAITSLLASAFGTIKGLVSSAWNSVTSATSSAWSSVSSAVSGAISSVKSTLSSVATWISGFASGVLSAAIARVRHAFDVIQDGAEAAKNAVVSILNSMVHFIQGIIGSVGSAASGIANALKAPLNAVIGAWNSIRFTIPHIDIPKVKVGPVSIGGGSFGGQSWGVPRIPYLESGGVFDQATLAVVGEAGREVVAPEQLLRDIVGEARPEIHVYIGERELTDLVRAEVVDVNTGIARTLLAGAA